MAALVHPAAFTSNLADGRYGLEPRTLIDGTLGRPIRFCTDLVDASTDRSRSALDEVDELAALFCAIVVGAHLGCANRAPRVPAARLNAAATHALDHRASGPLDLKSIGARDGHGNSD